MNLRSAPAVPPAIGVLAGAAVAHAAADLGGLAYAVPWLVALLACGIGLGRWPGRLVVGLAAGWLAVAVQGPPAEREMGRLDPGRPVTVEGRLSRSWWQTDWGWRGEIDLVRFRQGDRVASGRGSLRIELAGDEPPPPAGSRIRARGYVGRSPGYANRLPVAPGPWRLRVKTLRHVELVEPSGWAARLSTRAREGVERALSRLSDDRPPAGRCGAALARALVLGDPSALPAAWRRGLRRAGLAHLLAVSGLHAALVAALALALSAPFPRPVRIAAAGAAVLGYLLLVGPRPSLLRATAMALLAATAWALRRGASGRNALALTAAALTLEHPEWVAEVGFQLTVSATAGLVFVAPPVAERLLRGLDRGLDGRLDGGLDRGLAGPRGWQRWLVRSLVATLAAQLASLPFAVPAFHLVSWMAPGLNVVAVPYTAIMLAAALGWTALAVTAPVAARWVLPGLDLLAAPFGWPAEGPPGRWGALPVAGPSPVLVWWLAGLLAALAAGGILWRRRPSGSRPRLAVVAAAALVALPAMVSTLGATLPRGRGSGSPGGRPVVLTLFDVGQGDAILLQDGGQSVLVDGGGWRHGDFGGRVLLPALLGQGVRRLDAVVSTHGDTDHCRGLVDIASYVPIRQVWLGPSWRGEPCEEELARVPGVWPSTLAGGSRRRMGRWRISTLYPPLPAGLEPGRGSPGARDLSTSHSSRRNEGSLVLLAEAEGRSVLLTGDLYRGGERAMVGAWGVAPLAVDVLKVGHHGSKTSTGTELLSATRPRLALISAGRDNSYGHPAAEVVERLERAGARVLTTADQGQITLSWRRGEPIRLELPAAGFH